LLLALFLVTLVAVSALGWLGHSLLEQERVVEGQRAEERQEQAADRVATKLRETLAETGERLGYWILNPSDDGKPPGGAVLIASGNRISTPAQSRLLYRPDFSTAAGAGAEAPDDAFSEGENLEFQQSQPARALEWYRPLTESRDAAVRAGALARTARVQRKIGHTEEARTALERLVSVSDVRVAGVSADLFARLSIAEMPGSSADADGIRNDLLERRWSLSRGQFEFYWAEASRLAGKTAALPAEVTGLSQAVAEAWTDLARDEAPSGQKAAWAGEKPFLLIWSGTQARRAILAASPDAVFHQALSREDVACTLADSEGRILLGNKNNLAHATVRTAAETRLPWTLYIHAAPNLTDAGMIARQRFLLLITALMVLFLIAGAYFIGRAIRTEAAMSRMQSDFVSAVSHEFRSPLTTMRQLSEILALGRVSGEERRQVYYETLVRETVRLQRLVEGLLNFGRMEAGARRFRFEPTDAAGLIRSVAAEFEPQISTAGRHIEIAHSGECAINADPEALTVALRNLVDNALKYAPASQTIWLECAVEKDRVAIKVRDNGPGIPRAERKAIFRRFVRGRAAVAGNVKGSGVGLATVRHIVAMHGGKVRVASEDGAGSTFTILLPRGAETA
jgi:signal transduction histidine kinase